MNWMFYVLWAAFVIPTLLSYVVLVRHALRAGSVGWAVVIFLAPLLGGVIYYFAQYLPALRARRLAYEMEPDPALPPLA
jgi:hypothetical protein